MVQHNRNDPGLFDLPQESSKTHFVSDSDAWTKIEDLIPEDYRERVYKDYSWFVKEIKKEPNNSKYYGCIDSKDDKLVIEKFVNLKKNKDKGLSPEIRKKIKDRLLSIYCK